MSNWALIIYCGLITYLTRFSMIALIKKEMFNDRIRQVLSYVPPAIFPAIIFPAIFLDDSGSILIENNPKIMAALIAALIGIFSRSIIATIFSGLASYWLLIFVVQFVMKKIFIFIFCIFAFNANSMEKETTFNKELFQKAQADGKIVIVSSWIKYCSSCASQMKILNKAKKEGKLSDIEFTNIEYFAFDVTNKEIANLFNIQYQTSLLIFKGSKEVYRSIGETTEDLIYEAIKTSI